MRNSSSVYMAHRTTFLTILNHRCHPGAGGATTSPSTVRRTDDIVAAEQGASVRTFFFFPEGIPTCPSGKEWLGRVYRPRCSMVLEYFYLHWGHFWDKCW